MLGLGGRRRAACSVQRAAWPYVRLVPRPVDYISPSPHLAPTRLSLSFPGLLSRTRRPPRMSSSMHPPPAQAGHHTSATVLEPFWAAAAERAASDIRSVRHGLRRGAFDAPALRVARVGQLDAELLDDELQTLLLAPLRSALDTLKSGLAAAWQPELLLVLRLALCRLAIWAPRAATYGASMQNLRYRNERAHGASLPGSAIDAPLSLVQKVGYPLVTAILPYFHARLASAAAAAAGRSEYDDPGDSTLSFNRLARLTERLTDTMRRLLVVGSFLNLSAFLVNGKYRSLADRLLGIRLVYANRSAARNVSFEFLNRQLVWQALTEFLVFLLPLLRAKRIITRVRRLVQTHTAKVKQLMGATSAATPETEDVPPAHGLASHLCPLCYVRAGGPALKSHQEASEHAGPSFHLGQGFSANPLDPSTFASAAAADVDGSEEEEEIPVAGLAQVEAESVVSLPAKAVPCGCSYDYYCLASALLAEETAEQAAAGLGEAPWTCLRCGQGVRGVARN